MLKGLLKQLVVRRRPAARAEDLVVRARQAIAARSWPEAGGLLDEAVRLAPASASALHLRARVAWERRDFPRAQADYRAALLLDPDDLDAALECAQLMYEMNRFDESLRLAAQAAAAHPRSARAHHWHGLMLREHGRYGAAEAALREGRRADPASAELACALALVLADLGRRGDAESVLRAVLERDPEHGLARWQLAVLLLGQARFAEGWDQYDVRLLRADAYVRPRPLPFWNGATPPAGPLLVLGEQALGDELLFASCLPDLLARVPSVVVECDPRLGVLYRRSFPNATIFAERDPHAPLPAMPREAPVAQIAAGSLPALFRRDAQAFPRHDGYLVAEERKVRAWRERLAALGAGPKIGLSWRGGTAKTRRALRSVAPRELAPLLARKDVRFVSLQYGNVADDLAAFNELGHEVHHWPEAAADYDETAALVTALDLVITVQTAAAHLAGALGCPVWILLPTSPEWRYLASGTQLPWYPSATLFRQARVGDWGPVVEAVARALGERFPARVESPARC